MLLRAPAILLAVVAVSDPASAATAEADGASLGLIWALPFLGILVSIALFPLFAPKFWHHNFGKISLFWALAFAVPAAIFLGGETTFASLTHTIIFDYFPFIVIVFSLFVIAGGILVQGNLPGTPAANTSMLAFGTLLGSFIGTTGASMVMIRPMIRANQDRQRNAHVFIFFIFLIGNVGGSLTPLGPPLFLGYLNGVDFFWTMQHGLLPMLFVTAVLLTIFFILDSLLSRGDRREIATGESQAVRVTGLHNILFMAAAIGVVLASGIWSSGQSYHVLGHEVPLEAILRDAALLVLAALAYITTSRQNRIDNGFSWAPMGEVATLFFGIFITMIPALAILRAGEDGALSDALALISYPDGTPNNVAYFWLSGALSSFLDNAPTFLAFFNLAGGNAEILMGPLAMTLLAISCGSSFMGANTYIGNAPNFMIKSICEENKVAMPSFLGFMVWSGAIMIPTLVLVSWLFFAR
jgi:Na+/H+ antiporter NhaD/arsenite permease-like protein